MSAFLAMQCDTIGCSRTIQQQESLIGWWAVETDVIMPNAYGRYCILISQMHTSDFVNDIHKYFCCLDHAQKEIAEIMSQTQENKIKAQREITIADASISPS